MKAQINKLKTNVSLFLLNLFQCAKEHNITSQATAFLLMTAILTPILLLAPPQTISAKSSYTPVQTAPFSTPLKPNLFSSDQNIIDILPSFTAVGSVISNSYSSIAAFIAGPGTPEGLGAATPPPTLSERFTNFVASPLISLNGNNPAASKTITKKNISINTPIEESSLPEEKEASESTSTTLLPACSRKSFDFDGDCKADISRWQANSYQYKIYNSSSSTYTTLNLGSTSSKIAPADFDGDGKFDMTVFSAGAWTVRKSSTGTNWSMSWGTTGDVPAPGDYDGDGTADFGIYRPSTNIFWVLTSSSNFASYTQTSLGTSGDIVVPGDYDGNGSADYAVFRSSNGHWYYKTSTSGSVTDIAWGISSDIPVPGDFDSDGKTDCAIFRPSTGTWYVHKSSGGSPNYFQTSWGNNGDQPVPADYDGDGTSDMAIYRPTTGVWWILNSSASPSYTTFALGTSSDTAVPSAFLKQAGAELYPNQLNPARLAPINQTGGTNLYSRNFSWGTGLVGLPGRSGMNLNIGMGYNSLVWTKVGSAIAFDTDISNIAPGFNFGFPRIEPAYVNSQTSILSYLMVLPSGTRTEFRQTAATDIYETANSSYAQVKVNNPGTANNPTPIEDITLTVTSTDGTQMSYSWIGGAYRCTQVKDRNGNYITISNNGDGRLTSVTDTLGRVITINYGSNDRVSSITQNWKTSNGSGSDTTHTWASFTYATKTINTNFDTSLTVYGPANSTNITVLDKVTYTDGSFTKFDYNNYGQVYKVSNVSSESSSHVINYVKTDLDSPPTTPSDCPRFGETRNWIEDFNYDQNGVAQPTIVTNSFALNQPYSVGGISGTATKIEVSMTNDPYGLISKSFVGSSGWMEGLPIATEDCISTSCTGTDRKRWTWTSWTQDDTSKSYIVNPRKIESKVGDTTNTKRTKTDYYTNGLVQRVQVYDTDQTTILKKVETDYNLNTAYVSRRIIGLPSETRLYGLETTGLNLMSKVTYAYDEGNFSDSALEQNLSSAIYHDNTNYGSSFISGRGNSTSTTRWDINYPTNSAYAVTSSVKYNTTGAVVAQISSGAGASTKQINIGYADSFNDTTTSRNTYAYPTKLTEVNNTDTNNNYSLAKYRFDTGANVWAKSPKPANNTSGKETSRLFDSVGRLEKEMIVNTGAYTKYEYPSATYSRVYSTVIDTNNDGVDSNDEVLTESVTDGAGRVRYSRTEHPGSTGGYSATITQYDILGRVRNVSVPTEVNSSWSPAGDDYTRGWLWNSQEYDWKGRTTHIIPSDSNGADGKDRLFSYDGCGCAGGQMTTIQSESVPVPGQNYSARRTQKIYADILGRTFKTEVMNWDGTTPYTTTVQTFNGRDQVIQTTQYDNDTTTTPTPHQDVIMTYDGHGRLATRHNPVEDGDTSWTYNTDDSVSTMTDPRGVTTNYTYNSRGLVSQIGYDVPTSLSSSVPDPGDVTFTYDALGNRTQMTDGTGTHSYAYDQISRLTSETKSFTGLTGNFTLSYGYQVSGKLKSITDPFSAVVNYVDDKAGRTTDITGSGFMSVTNYASNIKYRAFGGVKEMTYGSSDSSHVSYQFDNKLRISNYESTSSILSGGYVRKANYEYNNDGQIKMVDNQIDSGYDQSYQYDHAGRLTSNQFGTKTNLQNEQVQTYGQTISYNVFDDITGRNTNVWSNESNGFTATYINGRKQNSNELYDALGNIVDKTTNTQNYERWKFDAVGRLNETSQGYRVGHVGMMIIDRTETITNAFDGDGQIVKRVDARTGINRINNQTSSSSKTEYYVRSSVLDGKVLTELDGQGAKKQTNIYTGDAVLAEQGVFSADGNHSSSWSDVQWKHQDIITGSYTKIGSGGSELALNEPPTRAEFEPLGAIVPQSDPTPPSDDLSIYPTNYKFGGNVDKPEFGCEIDGGPIPCNLLSLVIGSFKVRGVGARTQGMEGGWGALQSAVSIWRYDKYLKINVEDRRLTPAMYKDKTFWAGLKSYGYGDYGLLVKSWIEGYVTPMGNMLIADRPLTADEQSKFNQGRDKARERVRDNQTCRNAIAELLELEGGGAFPTMTLPLLDIDGNATATYEVSISKMSVYNFETQSSPYLAKYDSINMQASGSSGSENGGTTYGYTIRRTSLGVLTEAPITWNREFFNLSTDARALHILHEIMHQYATDVSLANRIAKLTGDNRTFKDDEAGRLAASNYFNHYLADKCNLPEN